HQSSAAPAHPPPSDSSTTPTAASPHAAPPSPSKPQNSQPPTHQSQSASCLRARLQPCRYGSWRNWAPAPEVPFRVPHSSQPHRDEWGLNPLPTPSPHPSPPPPSAVKSADSHADES